MRPRAHELAVVAVAVVAWACDDERPSRGSLFTDRRPRTSGADAAPAPPPVPDAAIALDCLPTGDVTSIVTGTYALRWCQDSNGDRREDRCHEIARPGGNVVYSEWVSPPDPPLSPVVRGLVDDDLDGYLDDVPSGEIEVCAAGDCLTLRPKLGIGDVVDRLRVREDGAYVALAISDAVGADGHVELWSLRWGRRIARIPVPNLHGGTYLFDVTFAGDAVIVQAESHDTDLRQATIHGVLDGRRRARVAGGSEQIIPHQIVSTDLDTVAVALADPDDEQVEVVSQDVRTGRTGRRVAVRTFDETARLFAGGGANVVLVQDAADAYTVALVDLSTGDASELTVPRCP